MVKLILNHAMPATLGSGLLELAHGQSSTTKYLFVPLYSRGATSDEQNRWLKGLVEHERPLYDAVRLRFTLEFKNPAVFSATPYVGVIAKGETLYDVIAHDLRENLGYKKNESFAIHSIEYRDTVTNGGEDTPRIIVRADLSYPLDVSSIAPHNLQVFWAKDTDETYGVGPIDHH